METIMKDLTCAPVTTIDYFGDNLGNELLDAYKNGWIIIGGTGDTEASQILIKDLGLDPKTDHEILLVYKLTDENINQITNNSLNISTNDDYNIVLKIRNLNDKNRNILDYGMIILKIF